MTIDLLVNLLALCCLVILSCAWIWGVHGAFHTIGLAHHWFFASWPDNMKKPVYDCPVCMPTIHVPLMWFMLEANGLDITWRMVFVAWIATAGLNYIIKEFLYPETE